MSGKESIEQRIWKIPIQTVGVWLLSAGVFLLIFSFLIARSAGSSRLLAYASSAVSFLAALAAGLYLARQGKRKRLLTGLLTGLGLCLLLLLAGFLIDAHGMSTDAVLSLSSFTLAGALVGSVLSGGAGKGRTRRGTFKRKA